ncbi:MAG: efflux RND transporter permease subunit [Gammaproteobacteria bacterium]|nr:efflux RND transporter permease subunit [Gammaproteobacteria bacterium]
MIWNFCIRRPVFTSVIWVVVAIFGIYGFNQMPVREQPDVDPPIVSVNVVLLGAEPEVLEIEVIEPLEEEINTIEGLKELTSTARDQVATITAEFELWRDIDVAAQDVRDRVNRARRGLPDEVEEPIVRKLDPDAQAIMWVSLLGDERWDTVRMSEYADTEIKERLSGIRGVGQVVIGGERSYAVRVRLDPALLAAHQLTIQDVVDTIQRNNVDIPSGRVESRAREFLVRTQGQFESAAPINDLIVRSGEDGPVRIGDVGEAVDAVQNDRQLARFTGEPTVGMGVVKQSDANAVQLSATVRSRLADIAEDFPPGLSYEIATDDTTYVAENIADLQTTIILATALVILVVLIFLRSPTGTIAVALAIPTSLAAGFAAMHALGFSLNVLSMLALILVIGIVIDDAIVVLEATYRHMEGGAEPKPAARTATTEVAFPAIANSLSLAAVFIPVAFTGGMIGRFFFEFGVTVTATVLASTATALTLTPMLCSRFLSVPERHGRLFEASERGFQALERGYERLLAAAFRQRTVTVASGISALVVGLLAFNSLSTEFAPAVDRSELMISYEVPQGATLRETDTYARAIEDMLRGTPEVSHWFLAIALSQGGPGEVNRGVVFVKLVPTDQRERHQQQIMQSMREALNEIPMGRGFVLDAGGGPGGSAPLQVVLQHGNLDTLARQQERLMRWMRNQREFVDVNSNLRVNAPRVEVDINRDKAAQNGISVADISNTLRFMLGEPEISQIERNSERYEVITEVGGRGDMVPDMLADLYVRSGAGELVALGNLVDLRETIGPSAVHHFNRRRAATISASTPPGVALGDAIGKVERFIEQELPAGFSYEMAGQAQDFQESFYYLTVALVMSIVFIYLVLAAQFESLLHPFTILLALPLSTVGAFGSLWLLGMEFSVFAFIGLIMLMGLVTKNAILLVDYTLVLIARGRDTVSAAKEAARVRFRPVLMTACSTILGMMPIAFGFGAGGEARSPLGVSVAVGIGSSTLLTLVVIPVVFTLFDSARRRLQRAAPDIGRSGQSTGQQS